MTRFTDLTLDQFWHDVPDSRARFDPARIAHLPEPAQRYLRHSIAPGTPLATAVRLQMNGEIKLKGKWHPFDAEQVIRWDRGLIWQARTQLGRLPVRGSDRYIDGLGAIRWRLLGLIPVVNAEGPDISRSAAGRLYAESLWLPSALLDDATEWRTESLDPNPAADSTQVADQLHTSFRVLGKTGTTTLRIDADGRLLEVALQRWGNPDGGEFREEAFGGRVLDESTFDGYTIPSELRVGWYFGSERFESEGEFWRAKIQQATFR